MTQGNPMKLLLLFTLPMLVGNLFQQLYNMVDSMVIGKCVNANALAAVGCTGSWNYFFFSMSLGMSIGVGVVVAQFVGARDEKNVQRTIVNGLYVLTGISLFMSFLGIVLARPILVLMQTPAVILDDAVVYMQVTSAGLLAVSIFNGASSILRALGDAKTPLIFLAVASVINIGLDLLFVMAFHWSVFGVGLATILAQMIAAIGSFVYAFRRVPEFRIPKEMLHPHRDTMLRCIRIGMPVALQNSMIALSCIALQVVINGFEEVVVAANTALIRLETLVQQPFASLGAALVTYTGQNMGAGDEERVKKGFRASVVLCAAFSLLILPIGFFGAKWFIGLFVNEPEVIAMGVLALRIDVFFYFGLGMIHASRNVLNGTGDASAAMINGIVEVVGRVGFAKPLTMIPAIGVSGIWYTTGITWTLTALFSTGRYLTGKWKNKSLTKG